ncbi:hypothetical protein ACRE_024510 [Hapsidospora chrysogenum ATCC 11550]|uniref:Uncharacterized protein n=1 Tax=Hapsidospora chrysogenum (strain ATCC 11550 / CBS 779.69 / DSM 880 / IAM 14645 / JCM 23072 / IMI 49137) TaxID=857340 RepID=A0A086TBH3_HAPC1|nr:hypothetical protein ACRE_024510 [Hapsidospora chrysogenum ATCC 11550]
MALNVCLGGFCLAAGGQLGQSSPLVPGVVISFLLVGHRLRVAGWLAGWLAGVLMGSEWSMMGKCHG